jgi:phosphatidylserine/phosphatidylglycerophosphate/cardiolipin synthase-like enzyme
MRAEGPAAYAAFQFANTLWDNVRFCHGKGPCPLMGQSYRWTVGHVVREVPPGIALAPPAAVGVVPMIAVGRAGANLLTCGKDQNNPSDTAMLAVFDHASKSIRLSQQDLIADLCGSKVRWSWKEGEQALARAIARNVDVQIVLSNYGAKAGNGDGLPYSTCVLPSEMWDHMKKRVGEVSGLQDPALTQRMKERFHLASLRFSHNSASHAWPNGWRFANHAKMIIVDDSVFYIGSSNFYSSNLQELGYFVQNPQAARTLLDSYWNKLWEYSGPTEYVPH